MKKQIIAGIIVITCVALRTAVLPRSANVGGLPAEPVKTAVSAEIEARSEETPQILISADIPTPVMEAVTESNSSEKEITAEKETEKPVPMQTAQQVKPTASSSEPHNGDVRVIDGEKQIYLLGFGWIKDEGENIGTTVGNPGDELTGNKVGQMGGATVGSDGDINKQVGIMCGGNVAENMYENGHKIGIMGSEQSAPHETTTPPAEQPVPTGDVIDIELQPPVTKDSTPPPYKHPVKPLQNHNNIEKAHEALTG